jgi:hypothetical protein
MIEKLSMSDEETEYDLVPICDTNVEHVKYVDGFPIHVDELGEVIVASIPRDVEVSVSEMENIRKVFAEAFKGKAHSVIVSRVPIKFFKLKKKNAFDNKMVRVTALWRSEC